MPRALLFAVCDNVLVGQDNSVSLIQITNQFLLSGDIPNPIPPNSATQMRWYVFAEWEILEDEFEQDFEQRVRLMRDEQTMFETFSDFRTEQGKIIHRMIGGLTFFPLIPGGLYRMHLDLRRSGAQNPWQNAAQYPLEVIYRHIPVPA